MEYKYYCKRCEEFFTVPTYAPPRCPMCFCERDMILGPYPVQEYEI